MKTLILLLICLSHPLYAELKLPALFSDNMVLQSGASVPIWGTADAGEEITVQAAQQSATAVADTHGKWQLTLDLSTRPHAPFDVTVSGDRTAAPHLIKNVLVGEVWLASGQSNMEKPVGPAPQQHPCDRWEQEVAASSNPEIRVFTVTKKPSDKPLDDCQGKWEIASPQTTAHFTAIGYFFARELHRELHVPVGIIHSSWGGTRAESWTSLAGLSTDADLAPLAQQEVQAYQNYPRAIKQYHTDLAHWAESHQHADTGNQGLRAGFADPATSTADWPTINMGSAKKDSIPAGIRWYRKTVTIPPEWQGRAAYLNLGIIEGLETVYVNGTAIGGLDLNKAESIHAPRQYLVPPNVLKPGVATIALRIVAHLPAHAPITQSYRVALASQGPKVDMSGPWNFKDEATFPPLGATALSTYPTIPAGVPNFDVASFLFNGMINPVIPYKIAGVLWYQGESNASTAAWTVTMHPGSPWYAGDSADPAALYKKILPALIRDWRAQWQRRGGQSDVPFYFCQIANYGKKDLKPTDSKWAEVREAERLTLAAVPHTGMAILIDIGQAKDIHPTNKQEAAHRLALQALAQTYGRTLEASGPLYQSMTIEGNKIRLKFSHAGAGLIAVPLAEAYQPQSYDPRTEPLIKPRPNSPLQGFALRGATGPWVWADAVIDGDSVLVSAPEIAEPKAVRYAWSDNPTCNLYNAARLPASPFSTE